MPRKLTPYINGELTLDNFINYIDKCIPGSMRASITSELRYGSVYFLTVKAGSVIEVDGNLYYFDEDTEGTNASYTVEKIYFYLKYSTGEIIGRTFAPVWSNQKQGWYGEGGYSSQRYIAVITLVEAGGEILKTELMDSIYYESYI